MCSCPRCSSSDLTRDGHDERGRAVYACAGCGRHATAESASLVFGHLFPREASCSLFGTTSNWVPRPNASPASSRIEALT